MTPPPNGCGRLGRLYPCYETAEELDRRRKRQQALGKPPIYDRAALKLTADDRAALEAQGRRPHWRFQLEERVVRWSDLVRGESHIDCASLSDPVLIREDGGYLYTLPSVVDDIDLGVTHVIRGEDHVTNTAVQIQIFEALGGATPQFRPPQPARRRERRGAFQAHRRAVARRACARTGSRRCAVAALAVLVGSADAVRPIASLEALAATFDLGQLSHAPARFDPAELVALSARTLHETPFAEVAARLAELGIAGKRAEPFWAAVRGNLGKLSDALVWWEVVERPARRRSSRTPGFSPRAAAELPPEPWDSTVWSRWTAAVKRATGRKGRELFHPLRLALTARESGAGARALLPLIGRARARDRLSGRAA